MVRFKHYKKKRRYSNSTRVIKMKFQSFMDISTSADSMQIITISAGGPEVLRRLSPQFSAYKYYKIGNISVKLVPASTLPVDPTGLSYEVGAQTVDPRDQLTPGLMRITNGEDVFENISGLTSDEQHAIYNNMLLDPRWFKWMLQSGVKRHAVPRYWQIGQLHQDKYPGSVTNTPYFNTYTGALEGTAHNTLVYGHATGEGISGTPIGGDREGSSPYGLFQTGHRGVLGWMPTDGLQITEMGNGTDKVNPLIASPVEVECMKIILPKSFKTRYYYRAFITETVYFKEPIVNFGIPGGIGVDNIPLYYRPLDVFHVASDPSPVLPTQASESNYPNDANTGGNYGDD